MTTNDQIKCVSREVIMREKMYPIWVSQGKLRKEEAAWEIEAMKSVLFLLRELDGQKQGTLGL